MVGWAGGLGREPARGHMSLWFTPREKQPIVSRLNVSCAPLHHQGKGGIGSWVSMQRKPAGCPKLRLKSSLELGIPDSCSPCPKLGQS